MFGNVSLFHQPSHFLSLLIQFQQGSLYQSLLLYIALLVSLLAILTAYSILFLFLSNHLYFCFKHSSFVQTQIAATAQVHSNASAINQSDF